MSIDESKIESKITKRSKEQARLLARLVERIDYQAAQQTVAIAFRPDSSTALAEELTRFAQESNP